MHMPIKTPIITSLFFTALLCACTSSPNECTPEPQADCAPNINTDFASLHKNIFSPRCATAGNNCHSSEGKQGNLQLSDPDAAYNALLGMDGTHARVLPGDPSCSMLMQRLDSDDPNVRMPKGENKLADGSRCAVRQWIQAGAVR